MEDCGIPEKKIEETDGIQMPHIATMRFCSVTIWWRSTKDTEK